jgi:hypothetical protein
MRPVVIATASSFSVAITDIAPAYLADELSRGVFPLVV